MTDEFLEQYEIIEKVGEGAMATVYRGRHRDRDEEVAIKVLHPHLTTNERTRTRFEREAQVITSLDSEHIPRIHAYMGDEGDRCYLVTEFVRGPTLMGIQKRDGRLPSEVVILIALQVCDALLPAHQQGIVHRDIKPANIMLDDAGKVKLMDFGVARILDEATLTLTGTLVGSPAFMSPEQARNDNVGHRSDVFSIGTLLYLLATGTFPFAGRTPATLLGAIIDGTHDDPTDRAPEIHPMLGSVIERCLQTAPEDRYPDVGELIADLKEALADSDIDPDDPGPFALGAFLKKPEEYRHRLKGHIVAAHVRRGKELLGVDQPADALRLINRVLTMDEGNEAAMELLTSPGEPSEG